ncbi:unnamed protein product [Arctia plantaginis]|uniref:Uncharacterized protein n=1 Tax=Arctia plantaginis TaxID=874455 RepID=A0A8S0YT40_ARCPL|nr:unnamed protein product [Arctia plantaginis]
MRSSRSINARHLAKSRAMDIFANAACLAYAYTHSFNFNKVYTVDGQEMEVTEDEDSALNVREAAMRSKDPDALVKSSDGKLPTAVRQYVRHIIQSISDPREGTMDYHLTMLGPMLD